MEKQKIKEALNTSLLEKIPLNVLFSYLSLFFNKNDKFILPFLLSYLNDEYHSKIINYYDQSLNDKNIKENSENLMNLYIFFLNCKSNYKLQFNNEQIYKGEMYDPIIEVYNKIEKETNNTNASIHFKKCFYFFLSNSPFINISPCCSLMNIIYIKEYYTNEIVKKKQNILNVILYLKEDVAKFRINDLFGKIIFNQNNFKIKNKQIYFDHQLFMKTINNIYIFFNEPKRIIVNGGNKKLKHNFKNKNEYIIDNILFKLLFKSDALLIIYRV